jgi:hypothetical protein
MNDSESRQIAKRIETMCAREWTHERSKDFARSLWHSAIGKLPYGVVNDTLTRLFSEVDPDEITLPKLIEAVKTKPAVPDRVRLEGPDTVDPTATGPAARGLAWAKRHKIPPAEFSPNHTIRVELAAVLGRLGARMQFQCIHCAGAFTPLDVDAYVLRCMDAGRDGEVEPPRWCARCTPASVSSIAADDEVPF